MAKSSPEEDSLADLLADVKDFKKDLGVFFGSSTFEKLPVKHVKSDMTSDERKTSSEMLTFIGVLSQKIIDLENRRDKLSQGFLSRDDAKTLNSINSTLEKNLAQMESVRRLNELLLSLKEKTEDKSLWYEEQRDLVADLSKEINRVVKKQTSNDNDPNFANFLDRVIEFKDNIRNEWATRMATQEIEAEERIAKGVESPMSEDFIPDTEEDFLVHQKMVEIKMERDPGETASASMDSPSPDSSSPDIETPRMR